MQFSLVAILSAVAVQSTSAFVVMPSGSTTPGLRMSEPATETATEPATDGEISESADAAGLEAVVLPPKDVFDTPEELPGVVSPLGFFDPLGFAEKADGATMRRYREAEVTHGRVGMLAVLGFLAGEYVEGSSFLWNSSISGPAITHLEQVPAPFWILLTIGIGASESERLNAGWVDPKDVKYSQPGLLRVDYTPGDIGFDPFGLRPDEPEALKVMQTKELQNGRLAMIAAAGCLAQELASGKGILENLGVDAHL